jgi:hypothetical protein
MRPAFAISTSGSSSADRAAAPSSVGVRNARQAAGSCAVVHSTPSTSRTWPASSTRARDRVELIEDALRDPADLIEACEPLEREVVTHGGFREHDRAERVPRARIGTRGRQVRRCAQRSASAVRNVTLHADPGRRLVRPDRGRRRRRRRFRGLRWSRWCRLGIDGGFGFGRCARRRRRRCASIARGRGRCIGESRGARRDHRRRDRGGAPGLASTRRRRGDRRFEASQLLRGIGEPIRRPHAMQRPTQAPQHIGAQTIAVARRRGAVIERAVAFDAEHVAPGVLRILHGEVDAVARTTDLRVDGVALRDERGEDLCFERRLGRAAARQGSSP